MLSWFEIEMINCPVAPCGIEGGEKDTLTVGDRGTASTKGEAANRATNAKNPANRFATEMKYIPTPCA